MSVCSLISLSVSLCVLASSAGPSRYHGDESRHRQSAIISYTLPTEFLLYSPLVYICVLSLHSHTFSVSTPISPTPLLTSHLFSFLPSELWSPASGVWFNRKLLDQMAHVQDGATINMTHPRATWPLRFLFAPVKDRSLLPSPLHHCLSSPGPLFFFIPSYHFHLGLSSPFLCNVFLHLF